MRAIIYARVSTEEQAAHGSSIEMQLSRCAAFCEAKGWEVVEAIRDGGYSAKNLDRPGVQRLLSMVKARPRPIDAIVIYALPRLTRSVVDLGNMLAMLERAKVALAGPEVIFDTSTSAGRLMANLLTSVSQWEREQIGERTEAVMRHRKKNGLYNGGCAPFGFSQDGKKLVPHPTEMSTVRRIMRLHSEGLALVQIARNLPPSSSRTKNRWHSEQVRRIVSDAARYEPFLTPQ